MKGGIQLLSIVSLLSTLVNGQATCIKATCLAKAQTSSTLCIRQSDGTATQGGNVQYIYDQCDSGSRMFCDPIIDDKTFKLNGTCSRNDS